MLYILYDKRFHKDNTERCWKFFGVLVAACECAQQVLAPALQSEWDSRKQLFSVYYIISHI